MRTTMRGGFASATVRAMGRTVLIVDDHAGFRAAARALLAAGEFDVVGEAEDGASAVAAAASLQPEIVLLDVQLPDLDGFAVAEELARTGVPSAVVLISSRDACDYDGMIRGSGARGFISKAELSGSAIRSLLR